MKTFYLAVLLLIFPVTTILHAEPVNEVEIIFDASRSMNDMLGSQTRLDAAKQAMTKLVGTIPAGTRVGLRVFGTVPVTGNVLQSCADSKLVTPIQPINASAMISAVAGLQAHGTTPISYSLEQAAGDFSTGDIKKTIILISDGEESCNRNPEETIAALRAQGIEFVLHTIGFDVDAQAAGQLRKLAEMTGGSFADAKNADELETQLQQAAQKTMLLQIQRGGGDNILSAAGGTRIVSSSTQTFALVIDGDENKTTEAIYNGQEAVFSFKDGQAIALKKFAVPIFKVDQYNPGRFSLFGSLEGPESGYFPILEFDTENKVYFDNVYQEFTINPPVALQYLKVVVGPGTGGNQSYHTEWKAYGDYLTAEQLAEARLADAARDRNLLAAENGGQLIAGTTMDFKFAIDGVGMQSGKALSLQNFPQEAIFGFKGGGTVSLKKIAIPIYEANTNNCKTFEFYASTTTPTGEYTKLGSFETMNMVFAGNPYQEYVFENPVEAKFLKVRVLDTHGLYYCNLPEIQAVGTAE